MIRPPPRSTLFPYATHFRADQARLPGDLGLDRLADGVHAAFDGLGGVDGGLRLGLLRGEGAGGGLQLAEGARDRKSIRLNSSYANIPHAVFRLKKSRFYTAS